MREHKFRGKTINSDKILNDKWIYGSLLYINKNYQKIRKYTQNYKGGIEYLEFQVEPKTVGQYTDMKDKNNKDIYESDILKFNNIKIKIAWDKDTGGYLFRNYKNNIMVVYCNDIPKYWEIIGNIYDNLKGGGK